jgi:hypothetical protein
MSSALLSSRQREILEALAEGAVLRWAIYRGEWRYLLDGILVDGRSVDGLRHRGLVMWQSLRLRELVLTDAGRAAIGAATCAEEGQADD